jgi:hypothetical protein
MKPPSSGNLRFVLVADPGLPSEMARDLAPRLPEDLRRRIARGIRWQAHTVTAPLVADEQVDVAHVAEIVGTRLKDGDTSASSSPTCRAGWSTTRSAPRSNLSTGSH